MAKLYVTTGEMIYVGDEGNACWLHVTVQERQDIARAILAGKPCWNESNGLMDADELAAEIERGAREASQKQLRDLAAGDAIRCRLDGHLDGVRGPICEAWVTRDSIAGTMGWEDGGAAVPIIDRVLEVIGEGKSARVTSRHGYCIFQPLLDDEDGKMMPQSAKSVVYI